LPSLVTANARRSETSTNKRGVSPRRFTANLCLLVDCFVAMLLAMTGARTIPLQFI
jgi:hypothetical protein